MFSDLELIYIHSYSSFLLVLILSPWYFLFPCFVIFLRSQFCMDWLMIFVYISWHFILSAPIFNFVSIFSELGRSYDFQFESSRDAESFYLAFQGFMPEKFLSHGRILYTRSQLLWKRLRLYVESRDLTLGAAFRRAVRAIVPSEFPSSSSSSSLSPRSTPSPPTFLSQNAR